MTIHLRALSPQPTTVDLEARTVEAIASTFADVQRAGYIERLNPKGADLSRFVGAPVLDGHRSGSTRDQFGVIEATELRPEGLWVRIKFRSNDTARAVLADIAEGTLRGLSIGYTVAEWKEGRDGNRRTRTANQWTALELSMVSIPADRDAHFRTGALHMEQDEQTVERQTETAQATRAQINAEIRQIAETAGLTRAWADEQIDAEATADAARRAAFEAMQTRSASATTRTQRAEITVDHTDPAVIAERAGEALFARSHPDHELSAPARPFAHMSIPDLARDCLRRAGITGAGMATETVITRALHTTSDFPLILGDTVGRELRRGYQAAQSGVRPLARQTTARDFRAKRSLTLGEGPMLEKVNEGGEFKHGTIDESGETYSLATFGRILSLSRQAMVNDDLGAFTQIAARMGTAAASFEAGELVKLVTSNPAMSDGTAVFHADHGNLEAAFAAPTATSLSAARVAMWRQTGLSGQLIGVTPRFLLVPPELQTAAEQTVAEIMATKAEDVVPFANIDVVVDPRLTDVEQWYVVADPAQIDGIEYAYLEGAPGPQIETRAGFEVDGMQVKVRLDFGCGWIDYRGWYRNG